LRQRVRAVLFLFFVILVWSFGFYSVASAIDYDGIWFLGFDVRKPPFDELKVRQAVAHSLDIGQMASFIPPGLPGFDPALTPYKYNVKYARLLMTRAKYSMTDKRLKGLSLLHTNGVRTVEIARLVQKGLKDIGMKVALTAVSARDEAKWERELRSGKYQLFLMGYKANPEKLFTAEVNVIPEDDGAALLEPLFRGGGAANFTGYANAKIDMLFDRLTVITTSFSKERETKLKEANKILYKDLPAVVLFYIEKL
jgi:peptide/nickel transport system substrate-binding protein